MCGGAGACRALHSYAPYVSRASACGVGERGYLSMLLLVERWLCIANRGPCAAADATLPCGGAQARGTASVASLMTTPTPRW
jgi:hypothetical protein